MSSGRKLVQVSLRIALESRRAYLEMVSITVQVQRQGDICIRKGKTNKTTGTC